MWMRPAHYKVRADVRSFASTPSPSLPPPFTMNDHRSKPIRIPRPSSSARRRQEPSWPPTDFDPLGEAQAWQSVSRTSLGSRRSGSSSNSSLIFPMETDSSRRSRRESPAPLYDLPPSARPRTPGSTVLCSRCCRQFYRTIAASHCHERYPVCPQCQGSATRLAQTRQRTDTMVATEYIPAWHRPAALPIEYPQPMHVGSPPRPLHEYMEWHGMTAPAAHHRPVRTPLPPPTQPQAGMFSINSRRHQPPPAPPPSSYLMSRLADLTEQAEAQFRTPRHTVDLSRSQSVDPYVAQSHLSRGTSSRSRRSGQ
ncbi:hypothetical protein C8Q78DRAFT_688834 [Trametes maxima]|nr:hypothetical protein C8Q78DRAFT_688834 [Trametes maxima]